MKRVLAGLAAGIATFLVAIPPAGAEFTENTIGCAGNATITSDSGQTYQVNATDKTTTLPRDGSAAWNGSIGTVTHDHFGEIVLEVGPLSQKLGNWGPKKNGSNQSAKSGVKQIPSFMKQVPAGKYDMTGFHQGNEGRCAGKISVEIDGSPFDTAGGIAVLVLTVLTALLTAFGALRGKPILGAIAGLFFGLLATVELVFLKAVGSGTPLFMILPIVMLLVGAVVGFIRSRGSSGAIPPPPAAPA